MTDTIRPAAEITILDHLPTAHVAAATRLYYAGLETKLAPAFGPIETALEVLPLSIHHSRCLTAVCRGRLVGILGLQDVRGSFLSPAYQTMVDHYGTLPALYRTSLLMLLNSKVAPGELYLDGVAVVPDQQGQGIGSALIRAFEKRARANGFRIVSLEVIDTNPRARQLYTRLGYRIVASHTLGPFSRLFGFRSTCRMAKALHADIEL